MDKYTWLGYVAMVAVPILSIALTWAIGEGIRYLRSKTHSNYLSDALGRLEAAMGVYIHNLSEASVGEIRKALADGKLTPEELEKIKASLIANSDKQMAVLIAKYASPADVFTVLKRIL